MNVWNRRKQLGAGLITALILALPCPGRGETVQVRRQTPSSFCSTSSTCPVVKAGILTLPLEGATSSQLAIGSDGAFYVAGGSRSTGPVDYRRWFVAVDSAGQGTLNSLMTGVPPHAASNSFIRTDEAGAVHLLSSGNTPVVLDQTWTGDGWSVASVVLTAPEKGRAGLTAVQNLPDGGYAFLVCSGRTTYLATLNSGHDVVERIGNGPFHMTDLSLDSEGETSEIQVLELDTSVLAQLPPLEP